MVLWHLWLELRCTTFSTPTFVNILIFPSCGVSELFQVFSLILNPDCVIFLLKLRFNFLLKFQIFDKEGRFKFQFGECGKRDGQLLYPNRVAVVRNSGDIIVTERSPTHQVWILIMFFCVKSVVSSSTFLVFFWAFSNNGMYFQGVFPSPPPHTHIGWCYV